MRPVLGHELDAVPGKGDAGSHHALVPVALRRRCRLREQGTRVEESACDGGGRVDAVDERLEILEVPMPPLAMAGDAQHQVIEVDRDDIDREPQDDLSLVDDARAVGVDSEVTPAA